MLWIARGLGIIATAILTATALPTLAGHWPFPNLVLVLVVVSALRLNFRLALMWAALGGITLDILTPGRGFYTLVLVGLAGALHSLMVRIGSRPVVPLAILIMLVSSCILVTVESLLSTSDWSVTILGVIVANLATMAILSLVLYLGRRSQ